MIRPCDDCGVAVGWHHYDHCPHVGIHGETCLVMFRCPVCKLELPFPATVRPSHRHIDPNSGYAGPEVEFRPVRDGENPER